MPEAATASTFNGFREGADPRQVRGQAMSPCGAKTVQRTGNGSSRLQSVWQSCERLPNSSWQETWIRERVRSSFVKCGHYFGTSAGSSTESWQRNVHSL